jgi:uncharacterized membrane protein YoaK (UPF0700 family)
MQADVKLVFGISALGRNNNADLYLFEFPSLILSFFLVSICLVLFHAIFINYIFSLYTVLHCIITYVALAEPRTRFFEQPFIYAGIWKEDTKAQSWSH